MLALPFLSSTTLSALPDAPSSPAAGRQAPYCNDAVFGWFDGESDEYAAADERLNALTMIPCLRGSPPSPPPSPIENKPC
jgi:hypothetical protein